jgi:hypothetical protein
LIFGSLENTIVIYLNPEQRKTSNKGDLIPDNWAGTINFEYEFFEKVLCISDAKIIYFKD